MWKVASNMAPSDFYLLVFAPCKVPSCHVPGQKKWTISSKIGLLKYCGFQLRLSLSPITHSGGSQLPCWEHLGSHVERPTWQEMRLPANNHVSEPFWKWTLQPQARLQLMQPQLKAWFKQLCEIPWVRNILLSLYKIPNPQKLK